MAGDPAANKPVDDPRVYFAEERTLLAWLRTGLGLMGVGFAVARFGLFLREMQSNQMQPSQTHATAHATGLSLWSGVGLVGLGVLVSAGAVVRHVRVIGQLSSGTWVSGKVSRGGIALATVLAAIGVGMALYLLLMR